MARLLVLHHSPTPLTRSLLDAVLEGARDDAIDGVEVRVVAALDATVEDFLTADGYLLGTTANFGYMSGALKHAFDSTYDDVRGKVSGRPFSFWIHGRSDTTGARRSVESITTGLEWRLAAEPVEALRAVAPAEREQFVELGGTLAALLMDA
ncbi:flavodoxin family protein [Luteipulveratus halotolerans]|uniref:Flavodoxin n=1 Tax=Luteipulveratus halotolerans TaxID=1631356 RepID=A0A0L6CFA4_9MICO|nr:flavodoxin family protein [Luteipulveratus halotolerans]KNX36275.1 flavodoxin [Luteipulveratus halotolerans]